MAETPEEKLKREQEESRQRRLAILDELMAAKSPQVEQSYLSPEEVTDYKTRFRDNLNRRDDATKYLMGLLFNKTPDPTAPGDPNRDIIFERSPNQMAAELKADDRRGKSKIGNFFRDIDYFLGDGKKRDLGIAAAKQTQAMNMLDNILKDQGTELGRAMSANNFLSSQNTRNNQNAMKIAIGAEQKMNDSASKAQNDRFRQLMDSQKFQVSKDLAEKRGAWLDAQTERAKKYAPLGQGLSADMRNEQYLYDLEQSGPEGKAKAQALRRQAMATRIANAMITQGAKPNEATSRTSIHWDKDPLGRTVPIPYTTSQSREATPQQRAFQSLMSRINPQQLLGGNISSVLGENSPVTNPQGNVGGITQPGNMMEKPPKKKEVIKTLGEVIQNSSPEIKAPQAVAKAITNVQNTNDRQWAAQQAIKYKLDADQIKEDERKRSLGVTFITDWNPKVKKGIEGTGGLRKDTEDIKLRSDLDTAGKFMLESASNGLLDKVMDYGQGWGSRLHKIGDTMTPQSIKNWLIPTSDDPDYQLRRMFPGLGQDAESQQFRTEFKSFMSALGFTIQREATGLQALGKEMDRIQNMLPQSTDTPTVALTAMLALATKKRVENHFIRRGYNADEAVEMAGIAGNYITPRLTALIEKTKTLKKDAEAAKANGRPLKPSQIAKEFKLTDFDPDDIIGTAVESQGISLDSLPVRMRRLKPKVETIEDKFGDTMKWPKEKEKIYPRLVR